MPLFFFSGQGLLSWTGNMPKVDTTKIYSQDVPTKELVKFYG
jgi:hypothetical protein